MISFRSASPDFVNEERGIFKWRTSSEGEGRLRKGTDLHPFDLDMILGQIECPSNEDGVSSP